MATFILVHGAWHGAWCWSRLVPELEALGHQAVTFDLPGHGEDTIPPATIRLKHYARRIVGALDRENEKVFLLGHSMGGMPISLAAEQRPDQIRCLVYLAAFLPRSGESLFALEERNPRPTAPPSLVPAPDEPTATLNPDNIVDLFYHDCSREDAEDALARLTPQPLLPLNETVTLSAANFGRVPRVYIECRDDRAISLELQRDMVSASPCARVISLDGSHSPFLSRPAELAAVLADLEHEFPDDNLHD